MRRPTGDGGPLRTHIVAEVRLRVSALRHADRRRCIGLPCSYSRRRERKAIMATNTPVKTGFDHSGQNSQ